jgi:type VI secretion system protein ImpH
MAAESGSTGAPLIGDDEALESALLRDGTRFEFFQAVRLLERMYRGLKPVGRHDHPAEEVVRFRGNSSLQFPASEIQAIGRVDGAAQQSMWVNFIGLTGTLGVLPRHYSLLLNDPTLEKHTGALREFLDLFNHRLISLFYRAWEKYRFTVAYERAEQARRTAVEERGEIAAHDEDTFSQNLFCFIGLGTAGLRNRLTIDDQILLYYAGLLAQRPRSAVALEGILSDYFGVPVTVVQFQGQWFEMNADLLSSLGAGGQNNQLGVSAVLWERIWDPQARFRIRIGPVGFKQFQDFLPGADAYAHLLELTRFFVGEEVNFEVEPILRREEVPFCLLGRDRAIRLGWSMWLKTHEFEEDVAQPVFEARVAAA